MEAIVTGVCGFIGARLAHRLLADGATVLGIDSFLVSYPRPLKENRLADLSGREGFRFVEANIADMELAEFVGKATHIFHLAAQAGVRSSWGKRFDVYTESNILATQKLLEAAKDSSIERLVYSSSSSVYGNAELMPTPERAPLSPLSPYAVSKLAGEHLCDLYRTNFGLPTTVLRYFTVYGPKPRPDQAVSIFARAILEKQRIRVFGDGEQLRGMTYVDDVVRANLLACEKDCVGEVVNIGGGSSITVNQLIGHLEDVTGRSADVVYERPMEGDARHTLADTSTARRVLGWDAEMDLMEGLRRTVASVIDYYYPEYGAS